MELITVATATAAVATAAAAAEFTATAATTDAWAFFTRAGNVDRQRTAVQLLAVHGVNGLLCFFGRTHGDERKAAGAATHAVHHQVGFNDRAVCGKCVLKIVLGGVEGKISYKQFRTHVMSYCPKLTLALSRLFPTAGFQIITELSSLEDFHAVE